MSKRSFGERVSINELVGYSSAVLFFVFAFFLYFNLLLPDQFAEYRNILAMILLLYGILRLLVTRSKGLARRRKEKIEEHRETLAEEAKIYEKDQGETKL